MSFITMIFKNLFRRKTRTFLTMLGISIGIATIVTLGIVAGGFKKSMGSVVKMGQSDFVVTQFGAADFSFSLIKETRSSDLQDMDGIERTGGVLLEIAKLEGFPFFMVFGMDKNGIELNKVKLTEGREAEDSNKNEMIIGRVASQNLKKSLGDKVNIFGKDFEIVGIYETGELIQDGGSVIPLKTLQEAQDKKDKLTFISVEAKEGENIDNLAKEIEKKYYGELVIIKSLDEIGKVDQGVRMIDSVVLVLSVLAIVIGGIGVANTMIMSVYERTREIGTLRALGWKKRRILAMILLESIIVCFMAVLVGSFSGIGIVKIIMSSPAVQGFVVSEYKLSVFLTATLVAISVGLVGGIYPAFRASKMSPAEALRYE